MQLNPSASEQVTAATDLPLALLSLMAVALLWRWRLTHPLKAWLWIGVFGNLAIASGLGVLAHGFALNAEIVKLLWHPLNAALALTVVCFAAGAVLDRWGAHAARRTLPGWLLLSMGFFLYTTLFAKSFLPFVIQEGVVMVFCLVVYSTLVGEKRMAGAAWMTAGVAITILAAALQATRLVTFTLVVPFDHNGVYHLIQLPGLGCWLNGLRKNLQPAAARLSNAFSAGGDLNAKIV